MFIALGADIEQFVGKSIKIFKINDVNVENQWLIHLFGEGVNIFDAAPPNVSLNKEEMGEEILSLKPLSPKRCMSRECIGLDTGSSMNNKDEL